MDFNFKESIDDPASGTTGILFNSATQTTDGLIFTNGGKDGLQLYGSWIQNLFKIRGFKIDIKFGYVNMDVLSHEMDLLMCSGSNGILYDTLFTHKWSINLQGKYYATDIKDPNYFSNSTLTVKVLKNGTLKLYKDNVLFYTLPNANFYSEGVFILGSGRVSIINTTIESMKIYYINE